MKTVKIRRDVKRDLEVFANGKSINKAMAELLKDAKTHTYDEDDLMPININMDDELWEKLTDCKLRPTESYSDAISRLLVEYRQRQLNNER